MASPGQVNAQQSAPASPGQGQGQGQRRSSGAGKRVSVSEIELHGQAGVEPHHEAHGDVGLGDVTGAKRRRLSGQDEGSAVDVVLSTMHDGHEAHEGDGEEGFEAEDDGTLTGIVSADSHLADSVEFDRLLEMSEQDMYHLLNNTEPPKRWDLIPPEEQLNIKKLTELFLLHATYKDESNLIGISRSYLYYLYRVCVPRELFDHGNYMSRIKFNHIVTQIYGKQKTNGDKEKRSRRTINKDSDLPLLFPSLDIELNVVYRERVPYYPQISLRPQFQPTARVIANTEAFKVRLLEEIVNRSKEEGGEGGSGSQSSSGTSSSASSTAVTSSPHHFRQPQKEPAWYSLWEVPGRNKICVLFQAPLVEPTQLKFSFTSDTEINVFLAEDATTVFTRFQQNESNRFMGGVENWPLPFSPNRPRTIRLPYAIEDPREETFMFARDGGVVLSFQKKRIGQSSRVLTAKAIGDWSELE